MIETSSKLVVFLEDEREMLRFLKGARGSSVAFM
jgi:hypothetical protein